ncbi:21398_t:CDS:2 [Entrophospora sp. SA101]|nr:21398_t:CDS:2 [Entrophospora sp. SA101]
MVIDGKTIYVFKYSFKISKIYSDFSNIDDIVDYEGNSHIEIDVIIKACWYIHIETLITCTGIDLSEWEFAAYSKPAKTSGEVMLEDLVEGFYMVFPGYRFDILRKLIKSETLKAQ